MSLMGSSRRVQLGPTRNTRFGPVTCEIVRCGDLSLPAGRFGEVMAIDFGSALVLDRTAKASTPNCPPRVGVFTLDVDRTLRVAMECQIEGAQSFDAVIYLMHTPRAQSPRPIAFAWLSAHGAAPSARPKRLHHTAEFSAGDALWISAQADTADAVTITIHELTIATMYGGGRRTASPP